ncbi:MAG TPA: hypothetical protein VFD70_01915, partial [Anaerolineae bacterium]|nr:hypothetical protein [Anaerolineae bacterium]
MNATSVSPTSVRLPAPSADELPLNASANRPTFGRTLTRIALYALALTISLFFLVPIYLIAISAFSPQQAIFAYPKSLIPATLSTDTMLFFWNARGVQQSL